MVTGYQADVDPDDFTPAVTNIKVINNFFKHLLQKKNVN